MPAVQTTFSATMAAGYPGMIADGEQVTNVISRVVDQASANPSMVAPARIAALRCVTRRCRRALAINTWPG